MSTISPYLTPASGSAGGGYRFGLLQWQLVARLKMPVKADRSHRHASRFTGTRASFGRGGGCILYSIPPAMKLLRRRRASSASAFPIARPKALNANASRKSAGSVTARSGALDARGASASSNGDAALAVAATRDLSEWIAGSA